MVFSERIALGYDLSCVIWKDRIFFPKTWYFFHWRKVRYALFQKIRGSTMILSRKNTPKGDWSSRWHSRKSSTISLYFHGDLYRRFRTLLSNEKTRKLNIWSWSLTSSSIYSVGDILQWIIFNILYHSAVRGCVWGYAWAPIREIICSLGDGL